MKNSKRDIRSLTKEELKDFFVSRGMKAFRAVQVYEWLWKKGVADFDRMTNLSLEMRSMLKEQFELRAVHPAYHQKSKDGTIKNALRLYDGLLVESVLIPSGSRVTACISSQVGCAMGCAFCATAQLSKRRDLSVGEIYDQVVLAMKQSEEYYGHKLSNIVFMGMGEPLLNYKNVMGAIDRITSDEGLGMSPKRITLSTVGVAKKIKQMADEGAAFKLAVSLHSALDSTRSRMMPVNRNTGLKELMQALEYWYRKTGNRITFEYIVWKGVNDRREDIQALVRFCKRVPSKVNLIPYNPVDAYDWQPADDEVLQAYEQALKRENIIVLRRESRGRDIDAACGQLAGKGE